MLDKANWRCVRCGKYGNQVDHIQPLHRGGAPFDETNLQVLCSKCHRKKTTAEVSKPIGPERQAWRAWLRNYAKG